MKTNQYRHDSEPFSVLSANDTADRIDQGSELDRAEHNRPVAAAIASRGPFPLRTLIVCFTIWLIATQAMIFDQLKFAERVHLLEQATQSPGGIHMVVPNERPANPPTGARMQRL